MLLAGATPEPPGSKAIAKARPNPGGICHTILYYSKRIRRVCRSTLSAEVQATSSGVESALWVAGVFDELLGQPNRTPRYLIRTLGWGQDCTGVGAVTDCFRLYFTLRNADLVRPAGESLTVYVSTLR